MAIPRRVAPAIPVMGSRSAYADNLKVCLVVGVIVAHVTMAWTGLGTWVFDEPHVREPLLTIATLLAVIGSLFGMALFFLVAGVFTPRSLARKGLGRFLADRQHLELQARLRRGSDPAAGPTALAVGHLQLLVHPDPAHRRGVPALVAGQLHPVTGRHAVQAAGRQQEQRRGAHRAICR